MTTPNTLNNPYYHPFEYKAIPATTELHESGIVDVLRTPTDGIDRSKGFDWDTAQLTVRASYEADGTPSHEIYAEDGSRMWAGFDAEGQVDGTFAVSTVSALRGAEVPLTRDQSNVLLSFIQRSIDAGLAADQ